jgi:DNA-binding response OmpR family regulator
MPALVALLGRRLMPASRILVVEDEPTSREILDFVLSGAGYGVDMAATAAAAVMLLSSTRYGLVIADWLLPDGDGIYIADRALALGSKTVIITGHLPDLPPGTGRRHRLLSKPVKPTELLAVVRDMIGEPPVSS